MGVEKQRKGSGGGPERVEGQKVGNITFAFWGEKFGH